MPDETALHAVPLTIEGSWMLHLFWRLDRGRWAGLSPETQADIAQQFADACCDTGAHVFSIIGHKADLLVLLVDESLEEVREAELTLRKLAISAFVTVPYSYFSVVELGLYESSLKTYRALAEQGIAPHTEGWDKAIGETLARQREAMAPRLSAEIPASPYICFYPMDRLRGEHKNWYTVPIEERARMMHEHGLVGRRYAGQVKQIISGSIGLDDWEWGVDLFAEDPAVFKRLIYEMRFDEVSAVYAKFGQFFVGKQVPNEKVASILLG